TLECGGAVFSAKGKTEIAAGWTALEQAFHATLKQKPKQAEPSPPLPALTEGQKLTAEGASVKEGATSPPAHFTEDTLLSAMEHASAEDFAKLEDVERKGLGTPATRAGVIE
ncbi:DNA topoisomerase, partial [uncultured Oscillibacter sp.]